MRGTALEHGPETLPFADWMAKALHDPVQGYYARQVRTVGRHGDFSTSATISSVLGGAIARWLVQEMAAQRGIRHVIEVGGGDGSLSAAVRQSLGWWKRQSLKWCMVETSLPLQEKQKEKLGEGQARWSGEMRSALEACGGRAFIFHNELLDAFPVRLLQWDAAAAGWSEVWLRNESGRWREFLKPHELTLEEKAKHRSLDPAAWSPVPLRDRQRLELGTAAHDWLAEWAPRWKAGAMLTLDYGDTFPSVYRRRPQGTVRAYFMHQCLTGAQVHENMGRQDVTADVNFTDLEAAGAALGWSGRPLLTQREFLLQHSSGILARAKDDPAIAFLLDEHGAGSAFKALIQRPA